MRSHTPVAGQLSPLLIVPDYTELLPTLKTAVSSGTARMVWPIDTSVPLVLPGMRSHTPVAGPTRFLSAVEQLLQQMIKAVSLNVLHQQRVSSPNTPTLETAEYSSCALMESRGNHNVRWARYLTPGLETVLTGSVLTLKQSLNVLLIMLQLMVCDPSNKH